MKKSIYLAALIITTNSISTIAQMPSIPKGVNKEIVKRNPAAGALTEEEVGKGLKEALNNGIEKGVSQLSKQDGYFKDAQIKLLLPDEAKQVEEKLRKIGQGALVDNTIESMNRAAEDAANSSKELFVAAIKNLSLKDVMNILHGADDAATSYLSSNTRAQLVEKFKPIIKASLDKVGATKSWETLFTTYNKIPLVQKINPDLVDYSTNKAIDGLFIQIAKEELAIRKNPAARVSDLLKKVFG
jgi:uncharacterized membrane protein YheB (UPF0754 family)